MIIHGSPSSLVARVTELKDSLKDEEKKYKFAFASVEEKVNHV